MSTAEASAARREFTKVDFLIKIAPPNSSDTGPKPRPPSIISLDSHSIARVVQTKQRSCVNTVVLVMNSPLPSR
jgi:hypothetical protein